MEYGNGNAGAATLRRRSRFGRRTEAECWVTNIALDSYSPLVDYSLQEMKMK